MSEVDRLSNSGLYPALPISDRQRDKGESAGKPPPDQRTDNPDPKASQTPANPPRPPKSLIDEYA